VDFEQYLRGLELFNHADFFEAHEALEDVWQATVGPERKFLQGLIQVAVALHHHRGGNLAGARSVLKRAFRNLSAYPEDFGGIHLPRLLRSLAGWQKAMEEGTPMPPLPKIAVRRQSAVIRRIAKR
jgi:predicted metal-dependent hydrolase